MAEDNQDKDENGRQPDVETFQIVRWLVEPTTHQTPTGGFTEEPFRPAMRVPVPVLTVLDDGSMDEGEHIRIRSDRFSIGRTEGDLVLKHDSTMSSKHADIQRIDHRGQIRWILIDAASVNRTFVRVDGAKLYSDSLVILGSRRFRLERPLAAIPKDAPDGTTVLMDTMKQQNDLWPTFAESSDKADGLRFTLRTSQISIGRAGSGANIELDDPLVAESHATLTHNPADGTWKITAGKTRNGVWISLQKVRLTRACFFQCGEQRFKFVIP
jgi:pSer/pThr/pTyr-binding forkhead associated (FHA) protein